MFTERLFNFIFCTIWLTYTSFCKLLVAVGRAVIHDVAMKGRVKGQKINGWQGGWSFRGREQHQRIIGIVRQGGQRR